MAAPLDHDTQYQFMGIAEPHTIGDDWNTHVLFGPEEVLEQLPFDDYPRLRIVGELNGEPYEGAWQSSRGRRFLMLSKNVLTRCDIRPGDRVHILFQIADQDAVDVPEELQFALDANEEAERIWNTLTPGKRRGLAYRVASAKRTETRERRVEEVIDALYDLE